MHTYEYIPATFFYILFLLLGTTPTPPLPSLLCLASILTTATMPEDAILQGFITTLPKAMTIAAFTAIAWYNALWLTVHILIAFKRRRGLYFWTIIIAAWGCVLHSLGFLLKFFRLLPSVYGCIVITDIGWYGMGKLPSIYNLVSERVC